MHPFVSATRVLGGLTLALVLCGPTAVAQSSADSYYRAYYLEQEAGDYAAAAELYADVAEDRRASDELRAKARTGLAACLEELQTTDFARLVPANTIVYAELNRPGEQLRELLDQLGLMGEVGQVMEETGRRLAIHPALVDQLIGVRGAAVAITGFNPKREEPIGVLIMHPGKVDVIRGLIETALPAGAEQVKSIEGYPTFNVEGEVYITVTHKLVIASPSKGEIKKVARRLSGQETSSLADNPDLADALGSRGDEMLFFAVNAKPILPFAQMAMAAEAKNNPEMAMAMQVFDVQSLRSLVGRAGVSEEGMSCELALNLDEGHKNLVFNLMRMPGLDEGTLRSIPAGAAFFGAWALNEARPVASSDEPTYVSGMDFGREIFGNIVSVGLFALPPEGDVAHAGGMPIPDAACVFTVNDAQKTEALWSMLLGIGSMASGRGAMEGETVRVRGVEARSYEIQHGPTIYTALAGHEFIVASSQIALARTLATHAGGKSVMDDPVFAQNLRVVTPDSVEAIFVHPGRCVSIARLFVPPSEMREAEPFLDVLDDMVISMCVEHSDSTLRLNSMVTGIPEIGHLVAAALDPDGWQRPAPVAAPRRAAPVAAEIADVQPRAAAPVAQVIGETELVKTFKRFAADPAQRAVARDLGEALLDEHGDDPKALNGLAWALLTEDAYDGQFTNLAWRMSQRSNELTNFESWALVDTLALAEFERGNLKKAVSLEQIALELVGDGKGHTDVEKALQRFQTAYEQKRTRARNGG